MKAYRILAIGLIGLFLFCVQPAAMADVLCLNPSSRTLTVEKTCPAGRTTLSGANFASSLGLAPGFSCTTVTGTNQGTNFNGEVGVAVSCSKGVMLSRSFDTADTTSSNPVLKSESIMKNRAGLPVGTQIVMKGRQNGFYSLTVKIDCCV